MKSDHYVSHHQALSNGVKVAVREDHAIEEYILKNSVGVVIEAQNWIKPDTNASIIAVVKSYFNRLDVHQHNALVRELQNYRCATMKELQADFFPYCPAPIKWKALEKANEETHRLLNEWYEPMSEAEKEAVQAERRKCKGNANPLYPDIRLTEREEAYQKQDADYRQRQIEDDKKEAV